MLSSIELQKIVGMGIELTTEKNRNRLLQKLLESAMAIANCDAGTLYLAEGEELKFMVLKTVSLNMSAGENGEEIDLPPVPFKEENVCAYAAIHRELINISDVYTSDRFDFSGPENYDDLTGYRTKSMLVIPLEDSDSELIGVLQLINKLEGSEVVPFTEDDEFAIRSIGAMAAVSLSEKIYLAEVKEQMHSFVQAFATVVDERTPYNGLHTRKVASYSSIMADYINKLHEEGKTDDYFSENRKEQLVLAATLHDIGKIIVPLSIMNKATKLGSNLLNVIHRLEFVSVLYERDMLLGKYTKEEYAEKNTYIKEAIELIKVINQSDYITDIQMEEIEELSKQYYLRDTGEKLYYITESEADCLMVKKGTLTESERAIMERHVIMTKKILDKVHFNKRYSNVTRFATTHHERLNGKGYPNNLSAKDLELESRVLAICDVFDALVSTDRPYREPMPRDKAFGVLYRMADRNELDGRLIKYLEEALSK